MQKASTSCILGTQTPVEKDGRTVSVVQTPASVVVDVHDWMTGRVLVYLLVVTGTPEMLKVTDARCVNVYL